jgi:hypothetical protein
MNLKLIVMRSSILKNWYKLSIAFSLLLFAFGFLIFSVKYNTAFAGNPIPPALNKNMEDQTWIVGAGNSIYEVTYSASFKKYETKKIWPIGY